MRRGVAEGRDKGTAHGLTATPVYENTRCCRCRTLNFEPYGFLHKQCKDEAPVANRVEQRSLSHASGLAICRCPTSASAQPPAVHDVEERALPKRKRIGHTPGLLHYLCRSYRPPGQKRLRWRRTRRRRFIVLAASKPLGSAGREMKDYGVVQLRNPVRAGLVGRPEEWPWGSYRGYCRLSHRLPWVTYSQVLAEFGKDDTDARRMYHRYVLEGMAQRIESPLKAAIHGLILGSEAFVEAVRRRLRGQKVGPGLPQQRQLMARPSLAQIQEVVARQMGVDPAGWTNGRRSDDVARAVAAYLSRSRFGYAATETAAALGYAGPSSVWTAVRRVLAGREKLDDVLRLMEKRLAND